MVVQVVSWLSGEWGLNQAHAQLPGSHCLPLLRGEAFPKLTKVAWLASQGVLRMKGTGTGFGCSMYTFFPLL